MKKLQVVVLLFGLICLAMVYYGYAYERQTILVTRITAPTPALHEALKGQKALLFSDIHITGKPGPVEAALMKIILSEKPDYIWIAGDLVGYRSDIDSTVEWLKGLPKTRGNFAILGDTDTMGGVRNCAYCHNGGNWKVRSDLPISFLRQEYKVLEGPGGKAVLAGTNPEWLVPDLSFLESAPEKAPVILLSHYPDALESAAEKNIALVLAGDTHGGQIRAPRFLYRLFFRDSRADYLSGWFKKGVTKMYVSRGIGTSIVPIRFGVPPEVVVIEF